MRSLVAACAMCAYLAGPSLAQDAPKVAGTDVPSPKRVRTVLPSFPAEAQAQGIHGIVILELTIDTKGKVGDVRVVRSVPPFDEPAIAAAKQWEYEVTKLDGKPVSVLLTVPITFALRVPEVSRQPGIPELRQGVNPAYPKGAKGSAQVTVEVTLDPAGHASELTVTSGEDPWQEALLQALRTWRFAPSDDAAVISFRVEADFAPAGKGQPDRVSVRLTGLRRSESAPLAASADPAAASAAPSPAPEQPPPPTPPAAPPVPPTTTVAKPVAQPPTEVLTAPPPPRPAPPAPAAGTSAVEAITLAVGVPDLTSGRRPVVPPFARMAGASGSVEVRFAVNAAGQASVVSAEGPELLKPAAEQAVASWAFRRTTTARLYLTAVFTYAGETASAAVAPSPEPPPPAPEPPLASPAPGASPTPPSAPFS